jgi:hypothetical protein
VDRQLILTPQVIAIHAPAWNLDPGIASTGEVRGDPRIRSGDDDEGVVRPAKIFSGRALGGWPGHDGEDTIPVAVKALRSARSCSLC